MNLEVERAWDTQYQYSLASWHWYWRISSSFRSSFSFLVLIHTSLLLLHFDSPQSCWGIRARVDHGFLWIRWCCIGSVGPHDVDCRVLWHRHQTIDGYCWSHLRRQISCLSWRRLFSRNGTLLWSICHRNTCRFASSLSLFHLIFFLNRSSNWCHQPIWRWDQMLWLSRSSRPSRQSDQGSRSEYCLPPPIEKNKRRKFWMEKHPLRSLRWFHSFCHCCTRRWSSIGIQLWKRYKMIVV